MLLFNLWPQSVHRNLPNFKQLALSKDGASHFLYLLNATYYDPSFTSAPDAEDQMVIINLDISNAFGTLCAQLALDVLAGKASRDYASGINADADFETAEQGDFKEIAQSLWYSVSLLSISGVAFLGNFQRLKAWLTQTMATSSRHFRQLSSSFPFSKKMETSILISEDKGPRGALGRSFV